jgi:hypothetical protein
MPLALDQAHALLIAERSRDATKITEAISAVLAANSETNLLEIEEVFRDAGSSVYLIAEPELTIVIGMSAWRSALDRLGMSPQESRYALAAFTAADQHSVRGPPCGAPGERKIPPA